MVSKSFITSIFIMNNCVTPFNMIAYFNATKSNQPQRRARPVVAPNSPPF